MQPKQHYGEIAAFYKAYRPTYPPELFAYLATIAPARDRAWDCATGSGQAAQGLKPLFRQVIATDASEKQIGQAEKMDGVDYRVAPAEQTAIEPCSVDLVAVAQALHWFDLARFYAEVQRVAKLGGVLACWCYSLMKVDSEIDRILLRLYDGILHDYWAPERRLVDQQYSTVPFPFDELTPPSFRMTHDWSLDQLVGYLGTWSAVTEFEQKQQQNPISLVWDELATKWVDPKQPRTVTWPLHLRVGTVRKTTSPSY